MLILYAYSTKILWECISFSEVFLLSQIHTLQGSLSSEDVDRALGGATGDLGLEVSTQL